jgi:hypothetical protein
MLAKNAHHATIVRAHQPSAGAKKASENDQAIGRSKSTLSRKIDATWDALGHSTGFQLRSGTGLSGARCFDGYGEKADSVLADKAYDASIYDKEIYKARHLIKNFFCKTYTVQGPCNQI